MKPIRPLISIVFLFCGLTAWGGECGYDQNDMVGTYKYEIPEYVLNLHLHTDNTFMVTNTVSDNTYKHDISGSSRTRKGKNEAWKDLIEQVVRDVVG